MTLLTNPDTWVADIAAELTRLKCTDTSLHLVLYTDGGCRPTPRGVGGSGIHGYLYSLDTPRTGHGCKGFKPTARGYINNERTVDDPATLASIEATLGDSYIKDNPAITVIHYIDGVRSIVPNSSNNEAELNALLTALEIVIAAKAITAHLVLDSEYVLKGCTQWLKGWIRGNWRKADGTAVSNVDMWQRVSTLLESAAANTKLSWEWVKGHSDNIGNRQADYLASAGVMAGQNGTPANTVVYKPSRKYWNPDTNVNPFFSESRWYFRTNAPPPSTHTHFLYHMGNHGSDDDSYGKPVADTNYAVIAVTKQEPVLEAIRTHQNRLCTEGTEVVVLGQLNNIFKPRVYTEIATIGCDYLYKPTVKTDLYTPADLLITRERTPALLALRATECLTQLEFKLIGLLEGTYPHTTRITDITPVIYESVQTKKATTLKVRLDQTADAASISPVVEYMSHDLAATTNVVLTVGIDMPKRNFFAAIAGQKPKVYVMTWPESSSSVAFRYATIVVTDDNCGIWAGVYGNLRIVSKT